MPLVTTRTMDRAIRDARGLEHPRRLSLAAGGDMDYSDFAFGFSISGAVVTVISGTLRHSTRTPMAPFEVAETDVSIAADHSWIYVSYTCASGTITIEQSPIEPQSTEAIFKQPLHRWRLISGAASIEKICHLGDISIPGSFA